MFRGGGGAGRGTGMGFGKQAFRGSGHLMGLVTNVQGIGGGRSWESRHSG